MSFSGDIDRWAAKVEKRLQLIARKIALDIFKDVILSSPVDTGRFRGNWQVAIGSVPEGVLDLTDPSGTATISKVTAEVLKLKTGDIITLVNNLPYAIPLEMGHSKQAPSGMVGVAVARFEPVAAAALAAAVGEVP